MGIVIASGSARNQYTNVSEPVLDNLRSSLEDLSEVRPASNEPHPPRKEPAPPREKNAGHFVQGG